MGKMATKKACRQLQKIFEAVGKYGGMIETDRPDSWWPLDLKVLFEGDDRKDICISVSSEWTEDILLDTLFHLSLKMDGDKILEAEIISRKESGLFGTTYIDKNDMMNSGGMVAKDPYGLRKNFSDFMDTMTVNGPYLSEPKRIMSYGRMN